MTAWHVSDTRLPTGPLAWQYLSIDFLPHSVGSDGLVYGHRGADRVLARVEAGAMELGRDFGAYCQAGEYITWATRVPEGFIVVTSSDVSVADNFGGLWFGETFTGSFSKITTTRGINDFCISKPEQGPGGGTLLMVGEYSTDSPQPEHLLRLTLDGGQSWSTVKTAVVVDDTKNSHFHGCAYDPSRERLWSSQGDNGNSMWAYSDDLGETWTPVAMSTSDPLYESDSIYQQPTTVLVFDDRVVVSPDRGLRLAAGLWICDPDGAHPRLGWTSPRQGVGEVPPNHFGRSPYVQAGDVAIVNIPDRFSGTKRAYMVGTGDAGLTWHLLSTVTLTASGGGSYPIVGPDADGLVYWKSVGNPGPAGDHLMVAPLPTWQAPTVPDQRGQVSD